MISEIGVKVKASREELKKNQREFAEELNIAQSALSNLESGKPVPLTLEKIEFLCDYIGIAHNRKKLLEAKKGKKEEELNSTSDNDAVNGKTAALEQSTILKELKGRYQENIELATKYMIAANVYQEVIDIIKESELDG